MDTKESVYGAILRGYSGWMQSTAVNEMIVGKWTREWGKCGCFEEELHRQFLYTV